MVVSLFIALFFSAVPQTSRISLPAATPSAIFTMNDVLQQHALWLQTAGRQGARADLRGMNLEGAEGGRGTVLIGRVVLTNVDLRQADFRGAKLRNVDFTDANLENTRFDQANLRWATLANAALGGANFAGANLEAANLRGANLNQANLQEADLRGADLTGARCFSRTQLDSAVIDGDTKLPAFENCPAQR